MPMFWLTILLLLAGAGVLGFCLPLAVLLVLTLVGGCCRRFFIHTSGFAGWYNGC